jgi:mRNA interferase RelE/StbE
MWKIEYKTPAIRVLARMSRKVAKLIEGKIEQLANNPYAPNHNVTALKGMKNYYRLRVGDWRVVYRIDGGILTIVVLKIAPRGGAYKQ